MAIRLDEARLRLLKIVDTNNTIKIYPNNITSYSGLVIEGYQNGGYDGIHLGPNVNYMTVMSSDIHQGLYNQSRGRWIIYFNRSSDSIGLGTNSLVSNNIVTITGNAIIKNLLTVASGSNHYGIKVGNTYINAIDGDVIFQNNNALRFGSDSWNWDEWAGLKYDYTNKYIYLGIADKNIFTGNNVMSGGRILTPGIGHFHVGNQTTYYITDNGIINANTVHAHNWFRSSGETGWYSSDYGGGWYMSDTTYVRSYNNKSLWVGNNIHIGTSAGNGTGLALYSTSAPTVYGIHMSATANFGKHGDVQSDWATYFNMNAVGQRGWIYRAGSTNVASVSANGVGTFKGVMGETGHILSPDGGRYTSTTSQVTGYLKITLPVSWTNAMLRFTVDIYDYTTDNTVTYIIGGYNYGDTPKWYNVSAQCISKWGTGKSNLDVKFGHDGSKCAVYIGSADTAWAYPQVIVRDVLIGYGQASNIATYSKGWSISFTTTLGTITTTKSNTNVGYSVNYAGSSGYATEAGALRSPNNGTLAYLDWTGQQTSCAWFATWDDSTYSGKPAVRAMSAVNMRKNLGVLSSTLANGYQGMGRPDGDTTDWIRTTVNGIIPYQSGGYSSLGTDSWPFSNIWSKTVNIIDTYYPAFRLTAQTVNSFSTYSRGMFEVNYTDSIGMWIHSDKTTDTKSRRALVVYGWGAKSDAAQAVALRQCNTSGTWLSDLYLLHSGNYNSYALPLSGGTMNNGAAIRRRYTSTSWVQGRSGALLANSYDANNRFTSNAYNPLWSVKSINGSWDCGTYTADNNLYFTYVTDTNFDANSNSPTHQILISGISGRIHANLEGTAKYLGRNGDPAVSMVFNWSGQSGQPSWLWGGNDGTNMYVYNPSNFSVNYANSAGSSTYATYLCNKSDVTYGWNGLQYFNASLGTTATSTGNYAPTADWYHIIRMNHANNNGYYVDIAACFHSNNLYMRRVASGTNSGFKHIWVEGNSITGAVWNDYAEYRESDCQEFGRVLFENGDDTLSMTTQRLQSFAGVSSDTWGFCQGETEKAKTPIAVAGRVLVYTYQDRNNYKPGDCVCAAPGGTVDIMTREEIIQYPDRIVGTVSCVPEYDTWGSGDRDPVDVNGRIWIKV